MAKKKKNEIDHNQGSLFEKTGNANESVGSEVNKLEKVSKGEMLECQIKRLLFFMGYYTKTNIIVQTSSEEPQDIVTDLDVYGIYIHNDFSKKTIWVDCKSGTTQEINRVAWLNGIRDMIEVDDILFVKKGSKLSTKIYANKKHIQIVDLDIIKEMEGRFGVKSDDWRNAWNPLIQRSYINAFKAISTPDSTIYKRILKYVNTHYWAIEDNYTRCKKTITALKDLAVQVQLPLSPLENTAIKWVIFQLCGMLMLAMLQISGQIQYFRDRDKVELINLGLLYGKNSKSKIEDILKVTNNIAKKTLRKYCVDEKVTVDLPEIKLNEPEYAEAFTNLLFRIIEQPLSYHDILRFIDFTLLQYDLNNVEYDIQELNEIFNNTSELIKSEKALLHFVCHATNMPRDIFILLKGNEEQK